MSDNSSPTTNVRELLRKPTDQVERPKPLPEGHYFGTIGAHEWGQSSKQKTDFVRFFLKPEEASDDVDENLLNGIDLSRKELRKDFFITDNAIFRLANFLDAVLGKETGRTFEERIPDTRGIRVIFGVTQRANGDDVYNDVTTIVAA